jgi:hypothetical protein
MDTKQKKSLEPDWTDWAFDYDADTGYPKLTPEQVAALDAAMDGPTPSEEAAMKPSDRVAAAKPPKPGDTQAAAKPDSRKKK